MDPNSSLRRALPFWYAFTGCDTTSQFAGHGKKSAWKIWTDIPDITDTLIRLSTLCEISAEDKQIIERFICVLYDPSSKFSCVNECCRYLFSARSRSIDNFPPTSCALEQHIKRSQLQVRKWTQNLDSVDEDIDPTQWGWSRNENGLLEPLWSTLPIAVWSCDVASAKPNAVGNALARNLDLCAQSFASVVDNVYRHYM